MLHLGEMGVDETTYNIASEMPERSPFEGPVDEEELNNIKKWREKERPRFNSSQTFQGVESLASKGVNKIFSSFCSEIAFCHSTATGELWMMGGTKGSAGRDYAIPIEEPEIEKVSGAGAIYWRNINILGLIHIPNVTQPKKVVPLPLPLLPFHQIQIVKSKNHLFQL